MKKHLINQKGVTLIELLLVLSLSSMVILLGVSFHSGMSKAGKQTLSQNDLRNESILVLDSLNQAMENADAFSTQSIVNTDLKNVSLVKAEKVYDADKKEFFEVVKPLIIEIKDQSLFIDGKQISDSRFTFEDSSFFIKDNQLICNLVLKLKHSDAQPYKLIKIYQLS
ncbi:prepilin-type N-terminal cleavage/methylation domain-containing protein [Metabacillus indicus]|uniref:prepilin-type N-terminal cleavage/methylation domain-containing protein n=1 Tax=Metabacillus indicus TaxID=246786 RepID=UPI003CF15BDD